MNARDILRSQAKKEYKKLAKDVPKSKRMPFAQFFKNYMKIKLDSKEGMDIQLPENAEDFDFSEMIGVNNLDSDVEIKPVIDDDDSEPVDYVNETGDVVEDIGEAKVIEEDENK